MDIKLFNDYATLKEAEKEIQAKLDELKPKIIELMGENEEINTDFGSFVIGKRRRWTYPENINQLGERYKEAKIEAERTGEAQYEENPYLIFSNK